MCEGKAAQNKANGRTSHEPLFPKCSNSGSSWSSHSKPGVPPTRSALPLVPLGQFLLPALQNPIPKRVPQQPCLPFMINHALPWYLQLGSDKVDSAKKKKKQYASSETTCLEWNIQYSEQSFFSSAKEKPRNQPSHGKNPTYQGIIWRLRSLKNPSIMAEHTQALWEV